jgi:hypothetical protein
MQFADLVSVNDEDLKHSNIDDSEAFCDFKVKMNIVSQNSPQTKKDLTPGYLVNDDIIHKNYGS